MRRSPKITGNGNDNHKEKRLKEKNRAAAHRSRINRIASEEFHKETNESLKRELAQQQQIDHNLEAEVDDLRVRVEAKRKELAIWRQIRATYQTPTTTTTTTTTTIAATLPSLTN